MGRPEMRFKESPIYSHLTFLCKTNCVKVIVR